MRESPATGHRAENERMNGLGIIVIVMLGVAVVRAYGHLKSIAAEVKRINDRLDELAVRVDRAERK
jgi:pantoate kinase